MGEANPGVRELGPICRQDQNRQIDKQRPDAVQKFQRGWIDPVQILKDHQHRLHVGESGNSPTQRLESSLPPGERRKLRKRIVDRWRERKQISKQRHVFVGGSRARQQINELSKSFNRFIAPLETCRLLDLRYDRPKRTVSKDGQAEIVKRLVCPCW